MVDKLSKYDSSSKQLMFPQWLKIQLELDFFLLGLVFVSETGFVLISFLVRPETQAPPSEEDWFPFQDQNKKNILKTILLSVGEQESAYQRIF